MLNFRLAELVDSCETVHPSTGFFLPKLASKPDLFQDPSLASLQVEIAAPVYPTEPLYPTPCTLQHNPPFLNNKPDDDEVGRSVGGIALAEAACFGHLDVVRELVRAGA